MKYKQLLLFFVSYTLFACNNTQSKQDDTTIVTAPSIVPAYPIKTNLIIEPEIKHTKEVTNTQNRANTDDILQIRGGFSGEIFDNKNRLWLSSRNGLACYDSNICKIYFKAPKSPIDTIVSCMLKDKKGNLWFGTMMGQIICYNNKFTIYSLNNDSVHPKLIFSIRCMYEDKEENLWIGTNYGVISFSGKTFTTYTTAQGLCDNCINCIMPDENNNLWFGTSKGICRYNGKSFTTIVSKGQGIVGHMLVWCMQKDDNGNIWIGTNHHGIWRYDGKVFENFSGNAKIPDNISIYIMYKDSYKNIWFNTIQGICKFNGKDFTKFTPPVLQNSQITNIAEDKNHNIWFSDGYGELIKYDGKIFTTFQVF